jgi:nitrite reductase (NO-forming)
LLVSAAAAMFSLDTLAASRNDELQTTSAPPAHDDATAHNVALPLASFAGQVPANADELAKAHRAYDATLPPLQAGDLANVHMTLKDMVVEIAPGVKYNTWAFDGHGAPGPVIHVREGQTVEMTLTNGWSIPHSIDFHAARIAPNVAFRDVDPGVFMYH